MQDTLFDWLNIDVAGCLDACVPQDALGVFQGAMMLEVRTQRPAHHLEGDQVVGDTELPRDGTNPPNEEILPLSWYSLPFPLSTPEGWEHQSLG